MIEFAEKIGLPLDPWEQLAAIRLGELLPDGRPRFRTMLILVARQNGKTTLCKVLICYWLFIECVGTVLGTSTDRSYAKNTWSEVIAMAQGSELMSEFLGPRAVRLTLGEEQFVTLDGSKYVFAANNGRAGRSLTVARWLCDELREHHTTEAWAAATNAMNAVIDGQVVCITNQGDARSIVLDSLRESALQYIETGEGDPRLGLLEWSAPNGADPTDLEALAQANPNLGYRLDPDALMGAALRANQAGGQELADFRTEVMCQRVRQLDPAIDEGKWEECGTDQPTDLSEHRDRVALCFDVSLDASHASLVAAAVVDGIVHTEVISSWAGYGCVARMLADLPGLVAQIRPGLVGWFPAGPAAAAAAKVRTKSGSRSWTPRRTKVTELTADTVAVCMGLAETVKAVGLRHPRDELQTAHIGDCQKLRRGDAWTFTRQGAEPIDCAYATAGAVHLARSMPPPRPKLKVAT